MEGIEVGQLNVLGEPLVHCCMNRTLGVIHDAYCRTAQNDVGTHTVCVQITNEFLQIALSKANNLMIPDLNYNFSNLSVGSRWCISPQSWKDAWQVNKAPRVILQSTHIKTLELIPFKVLRQFAIDLC